MRSSLCCDANNSSKWYIRRETAFRRNKTEDAKAKNVGKDNGQFGTCWVTDGIPVKIKLTELQEYLARGYSRGRKIVVLVPSD
jgi:hypothetical protein